MIKVDLMTYCGKRTSFNAKSVVLPTSDGNRTVLDKHMDAVVEVNSGALRVRTEDGVNLYFVSNGIFTFSNHTGVIIVDSFERADDIDFQRAHQAQERATMLLRESADTFELKKAEYALKRAAGRLRLK